MRKFLSSPLGPDDLAALFKWNMGICLGLFACLEIWRPYYFLTDDNFSGLWPIMTEIGRHLKGGQSPFISNYLFGGGYDLSKDIAATFWHPFYLLTALLSDTAAKYAIMDLLALMFILLAAAGFTLLGNALVQEFNPKLPVIYILFYTASWLFSSYILMVGPSWIQFLGNQSALPWLALGVLDRRLLRGTFLIFIFSIHEIFSSYSPSTLINGICVFIFAGGIALMRKSATSVCSFIFGNIFAILVSSPFLVHVFLGFAHSARAGGMLLKDIDLYAIPSAIYPFSFFAGNWSGPVAASGGIKLVSVQVFPYVSILLACAAAWCLFPAVFNRRRWRGIELSCAAIITLMFIMTIRPPEVSAVMSHIVFIRSMRWPFREVLQLLFFLHVFLLIRPQGDERKWEAATALFSLAMFILPLPFQHALTFNSLTRDREEIFSGRAESFWGKVKGLIKPTDEIATVIPVKLWKKATSDIPYTMVGTANFPCYLKIKCVSGYAPTAPLDQMPLRKIHISYWFGAYDETQVSELLKARPDLKIIELTGVYPLRLALLSDGETTDLSPWLEPEK